MPFPVVNGRSFEDVLTSLLKRHPVTDKDDIVDLTTLFYMVDQVSTRLYLDMQDMKKWRSIMAPGYVPTDPLHYSITNITANIFNFPQPADPFAGPGHVGPGVDDSGDTNI